jgi:hypothetical protein
MTYQSTYFAHYSTSAHLANPANVVLMSCCLLLLCYIACYFVPHLYQGIFMAASSGPWWCR